MPTIDIEGELVDFPDDLPPDQLERAVASAAQQMGKAKTPALAEKSVAALAQIPPRKMGSPAEMVGRVARDTMESLPTPTSMEGLKRLISPMPGQYGVSRTLQDLGESMPSAQEMTGRAAEKISESRFGQAAPKTTAAAGATAYALSHLLPAKLTPSEAAINIGSEGIGLGVKALQPAVNAVGRGAARMAEGASGLEYKTPGALRAAANDSSLLFGPGKKAAGVPYGEILKSETIRPSIGTATDAKAVIDEGLAALNAGDLTPQEAIVVRQAVDKAKNSLPNYTFNNLRKMFDDIAKSVSANADKGYNRAAISEALRMPLPINKGGQTSIMKSVLGGATGLAPLAAMSPAVQGITATLAGMAGRQVFGKTIPAARAALINALRARRGE